MMKALTLMLAAVVLVGCGSDSEPKPKYTPKQIEDAKFEAELYCTFQFDTAQDLYSEEYANCVKKETRINLKKQDR